MDEDNANEPEPTTSKKDCQKGTSGHELDKKGNDERSSNSDTWSSAGSYSVKSRLDMADGRTDGPKPIAKRESKMKDRRKKIRGDRRRRGRIEKRKRSEVRRQVVRRPLKRKPRMDRRRELSVSTIFTRLSPGSTRRARSPTCQYCGHRCCLKR
ncbi:hypothetical protein O3G_MSEX012598 [Manduca sexta]|uniref:Uncharacterized protein n=1 Tax=Manduca sexta TaxID=7130 RepID=A0A921ZNZ3_MANSE|nr:hypothetical protein O3G_MSEX012598 [Manduca sexta]